MVEIKTKFKYLKQKIKKTLQKIKNIVCFN